MIFRVHAIQRMFERRIADQDVHEIVVKGEIIQSYPEDKPYPSRLLLGWIGSRPLHVVAADNSSERETVIITVYEPTLDQWEPGFKKRRSV